MADIEKQIKDNGEKIVKEMIKDYDNNYVPKVEQDYKVNIDCRPCSNT